ncbi:MAG: energy-coupling factor transporter transmembrane protein EcfT [Clostridia bacterium]|nr:energy-coupling factor transporter transmembrane protein EcfT [Clostridia bacterium]
MLKNNISFGQYYQAKSFIHSMDSRVKILLLIAYFVTVFLVKNFWGFLACGIFLLCAVLFSQVPVGSVLKSVRGILFLILFTVVLNLFFYGGEYEKVYFQLGNALMVTDASLKFSAFMALRLTLLVMGSSILTLTTTPVQLTDGIESLLAPLKIIKFPVHELALIMSIALRFIPTLADETERIINAQKARGGDFESGNLVTRAKAMIPILIPLLVSSFRRAEELGDAMDARCYSGSKGRTRYKKMKLTYRDLVATIVCLILIAGVIYLNGALPVVL